MSQIHRIPIIQEMKLPAGSASVLDFPYDGTGVYDGAGPTQYDGIDYPAGTDGAASREFSIVPTGAAGIPVRVGLQAVPTPSEPYTLNMLNYSMPALQTPCTIEISAMRLDTADQQVAIVEHATQWGIKLITLQWVPYAGVPSRNVLPDGYVTYAGGTWSVAIPQTYYDPVLDATLTVTGAGILFQYISAWYTVYTRPQQFRFGVNTYTAEAPFAPGLTFARLTIIPPAGVDDFSALTISNQFITSVPYTFIIPIA